MMKVRSPNFTSVPRSVLRSVLRSAFRLSQVPVPSLLQQPDVIDEPMDSDSSAKQPPKEAHAGSTDDITTAFDTLKVAAAEIGFSIHEVPRDGDCLFSAIAYQLHSIGLQNIDAQTLRKLVVNYLRDNPFVDNVHYSEFQPEPVACDKPIMLIPRPLVLRMPALLH